MNNSASSLQNSKLFLSLAKEIRVPYYALENLIRTAPHRYKCYKIPKRGKPNSFRTIAHPAKELKIVQRWIIKEILLAQPVHEAAQAYEKELSIKTNAEKHASNKFILKMDFTNFFGSIVPYDLLSALEKSNEIDKHDKFFLEQALFYKENRHSDLILSIGAPSSPKISNIVMYEFDNIIYNFCKKKEIIYTRYADDLTFSTNKPNLLKGVEKKVVETLDNLESPKLSLNNDKTIHLSKKQQRRITGLVISNEGKVSLGRNRKRTIRSAVHNYSLGKIENFEKINELKGWISFAGHIEPEFIDGLKKKYKKEIEFFTS